MTGKTMPEQTMEEKAKIFDILKFEPCTYTVRLWGYGGEVVLGEVDKKVWDYFREHKIDVGDYACDSEYGEELNVPEECQPFYPGEWHDCDNLYHGWGVSRNAGTLEIENDKGEIIYTRELSDLDGCDVSLSCGEEAWIEMKGEGSCVFYNYSSEKGTFFEGSIELKAPFNPEKLCINYDEVEGEELVTGVEYDGELLDNFGGDTTGKGYDFKFYHVKEGGYVDSYANGYDLDDDFDDGTPPMGPSPDDWEKSPKITKGNPTISGWYSCHYLGSTWGSLYWNNEKNVWEDYYHGRVSSTYDKVNWYQGYNWDTSDWANQPKEPPTFKCKCGWMGSRDELVDDENYDSHCPSCNSVKTEYIEYDPDTAKGRKNRAKYIA